MVDLTGLNPEQYQAVTATEGALLVLAGAGSGKTRVITFRIAHLMDQGVHPSRILALSFTNKAAMEMTERLVGMLGKRAKGCTTSTFHALGVQFLKAECASLGLSAGFTILDEADQRDAVRRALRQLGFDTEEYDPKAIHARISHYKGRMQAPDPRAGRLDALATHIMPLYQARLRAMNAVDFDDLIALPVRALETNTEVAQRWGQRFRYIMVDEYQDTNGAQLRMIKGLVKGFGNVCVVGDDDQSIYAFRGAVAGNILGFDQHFIGARTIALTQNYRSTNSILRAANHVIGNNTYRHEKTLWSENGDGALLRYQRAETEEDEAHWLATDLLGQKSAHDLKWSDFAVLYRANVQSRVMEEAIRGAGIPYKIIGGTQFYDRKEVRDLVAYLRVITNPFDESAYRRIINYPMRRIGDVTIQKLADHAASTGTPFWHLVRDPSQVPDLPEKMQQKLKALDAKIADFRDQFAQGDLAEVCRRLVRTFGFADELARTYKQTSQIRKRMNNVEEVASALRAYKDRKPEGDLADYLARLQLDSRQDDDDDDTEVVSLMTLHGSKGLEFTYVYLIGCEEGLMPHQRVLDGEGDIPEERRLAYVGITRAKRFLTITGAEKRLKFGKVQHRRESRFLHEIPESLFAGGRNGKAPGLTAVQREHKAKNAFAAMLSEVTSS